MMRRTQTRSSLLGAGPQRTNSQFSIVAPPQKRTASNVSIAAPSTRRVSQRSQAQASDTGTEKTYDPYRASHNQLVSPHADHATITLLKGTSVNSKAGRHSSAARSSNAPSIPNPAIARLRRDHSMSSMASSPPLEARDAAGAARSLRRSVLTRQPTTSSWASTSMSRESSIPRIHKSASYKRNVAFRHSRRHSSLQHTPPPRPRNPTPLTLQQRFVQDASPTKSRHEGKVKRSSLSPTSSTGNLSPKLQSKKEGARISPKGKNRTSALWEERTRQVSAELSNLCDQVFQGSLPS